MMQAQQQTYYEILGVEQGASAQQIESAYRHLALQLHPDKLQPSSAADSRFHSLTEIKRTLLDTEQRRTYDQRLARVPTLDAAHQQERIAAQAQRFRWRHGPAGSFELTAGDTVVLSVSAQEINAVELPLSATHTNGRRKPGITVLKKRLERRLEMYIEEHLLELETEFMKPQ